MTMATMHRAFSTVKSMPSVYRPVESYRVGEYVLAPRTMADQYKLGQHGTFIEVNPQGDPVREVDGTITMLRVSSVGIYLTVRIDAPAMHHVRGKATGVKLDMRSGDNISLTIFVGR